MSEHHRGAHISRGPRQARLPLALHTQVPRAGLRRGVRSTGSPRSASNFQQPRSYPLQPLPRSSRSAVLHGVTRRPMVRRCMQSFIEQCRARASVDRQQATLARLIERPDLHARFLNTLARLEYVGVRKMLKSRRADALDLDGLRHILEEAVHAVRLKKFAHAVADGQVDVTTFAELHTLAGDAAEDYFQAIDAAAARCVGELEGEACYWLTSTAIELRAQSFYPAYQQALQRAGAPLSVQSIISDEHEHLEQMGKALPRHLANWREALQQVMAVEESSFCVYLDHVDRLLDLEPVERTSAVG